MVSLQSALLPVAKRPPCLSLVDDSDTTATSKKRKKEDDDGEVEEDGIELNFDAAPLPPEWQRCLDIKSGQIHYYNTRTHKRTSKDPRRQPETEPAYCVAAPAVKDVESANHAAPAPGLNLDLNLTFEPRRRPPVIQLKKARQSPPVAAAKPAAAGDEDVVAPAPAPSGAGEMVAAVCVRCHMLVMMCHASQSCPNCKFVHPTSRSAGAAPPPPPLKLKLGVLQLLSAGTS